MNKPALKPKQHGHKFGEFAQPIRENYKPTNAPDFWHETEAEWKARRKQMSFTWRIIIAVGFLFWAYVLYKASLALGYHPIAS